MTHSPSSAQSGREAFEAWNDRQDRLEFEDAEAEAHALFIFKAGWQARAAASAQATTGDTVAQWQSRLREPILPECGVWINISAEGARSLIEQYPEIYEVRALYATPPSPDAREAGGGVWLSAARIRQIAEQHFWGGKCTTVDDLEKAIVAALREAGSGK